MAGALGPRRTRRTDDLRTATRTDVGAEGGASQRKKSPFRPISSNDGREQLKKATTSATTTGSRPDELSTHMSCANLSYTERQQDRRAERRAERRQQLEQSLLHPPSKLRAARTRLSSGAAIVRNSQKKKLSSQPSVTKQQPAHGSTQFQSAIVKQTSGSVTKGDQVSKRQPAGPTPAGLHSKSKLGCLGRMLSNFARRSSSRRVSASDDPR